MDFLRSSFRDTGCVARGEIIDVSERYRRADTDVPDSMESECSGAGISKDSFFHGSSDNERMGKGTALIVYTIFLSESVSGTDG
jgi:hypothetical protein